VSLTIIVSIIFVAVFRSHFNVLYVSRFFLVLIKGSEESLLSSSATALDAGGGEGEEGEDKEDDGGQVPSSIHAYWGGGREMPPREIRCHHASSAHWLKSFLFLFRAFQSCSRRSQSKKPRKDINQEENVNVYSKMNQ